MGAKTPVSILQEMMTRVGAPPKYDLIYDGGGTHTALFKYKVYADKVTAVGSGRSKKEAKHEAARIALERLATHQIEDVHTPGVPSEPIEIMTHYKEKLQENAVGALHDLCATKEIPMPDYDLIEEKGAPHDKIFTYVCYVSKQKEIGIGRTKKQAKQLAAFNMMNRLKESLTDVFKEIKEQMPVPPSFANMDNAVAKYMSKVGTPVKKLKLSSCPCKYNYYSNISDESVESVKKMLSEVKIPDSGTNSEDIDWMLHLDRILESVDVERSIVPGRPSKGKIHIFLQVNLSTNAVFYGSGNSPEQAIQHSARNAIVFLKTQIGNEMP